MCLFSKSLWKWEMGGTPLLWLNMADDIQRTVQIQRMRWHPQSWHVLMWLC